MLAYGGIKGRLNNVICKSPELRNGSTSGSSPAHKDTVGREARQESWFGVRV